MVSYFINYFTNHWYFHQRLFRKDLTCVHSVHKDRVAESKRLKNDLQTSKTATVNDLTKGIINYKYSGLDFEKAEDGRLRYVIAIIFVNSAITVSVNLTNCHFY